MKTLLVCVVAAIGGSVLAGCGSNAHDVNKELPAPAVAETIVGAWRVDVTSGAPYAPHLFAFLPGGVMISTNPSGVQAGGANGTTDSIGLGTWQASHGAGVPGWSTYTGTFVELNAWSDRAVPASRQRRPAPELTVTWKITITGDMLTGEAVGALSDAPDKGRAATFRGTRIITDLATLGKITV